MSGKIPPLPVNLLFAVGEVSKVKVVGFWLFGVNDITDPIIWSITLMSSVDHKPVNEERE